MKIALSVGLLVSVVLCRAADFRRIEATYQRMLSTTDDSQIGPAEIPPDEMEAGLKALTQDEVRTLLPLAWRLWRSPRPKLHDAGRGQLFMISWRADSAKLLGPYVEELGGLLRAPEEDVRDMAVYLLGTVRALPKAATYLVEHIDYCDSAVQLRLTAAALLDARPSDIRTIHRLLAAVGQRPDFKLKGETIQMLGFSGVTAEEALQFIRSGLRDADASVRRSSVDAVGRMPGDVRSRFAEELRRIASDPEESPETRSRAAGVLALQ